MTISLRKAVLGDAYTIARFNIELAMETEAIALDPKIIGPGVRAVLSDPAKGFYLVAEKEGSVVGQLMVTYEWSDWRNGTLWWIQSVYVPPQHRGEGIFSLLYRRIEEGARRTAGVCGLRLYVHRHNTKARQVYEKLGMVKTEYDVMELMLINNYE